MTKRQKPCTKMACIVANGERTFYQNHLIELQTKYARLEQEYSDFKANAYDIIRIIKEQR